MWENSQISHSVFDEIAKRNCELLFMCFMWLAMLPPSCFAVFIYFLSTMYLFLQLCKGISPNSPLISLISFRYLLYLLSHPWQCFLKIIIVESTLIYNMKIQMNIYVCFNHITYSSKQEEAELRWNHFEKKKKINI